jgi:hypothetical protein
LTLIGKILILGIQKKSFGFFMIIFIKVLGGLGGTPQNIHHFKSKQRPKIFGEPMTLQIGFLLSEDKTSELSHDWPLKDKLGIQIQL